ncbi:MAG: hypothetical protein ACRDHW_12600 [Ktedonobacteraceae bacterium]
MHEIEYLDLMKSRHMSVDRVSSSATCLCCQHIAWRYLLVNGGSRHNQGGNYCWSCGKKFIAMIGAMDEYQKSSLSEQAYQDISLLHTRGSSFSLF